MTEKLKRTFDVDATDVGIENKGNYVPKWYQDGINDYGNWWRGSDDTYYFYSVDGNTVYIQYGQNAEGWASTIFIVQTLDASEDTKGNTITVKGNIIVKMLDSVVTEYAGAGVEAKTTVTLNGTTIKDSTGMTNEGSTLDGEKTVSINETIDPQEKSNSTQLTMKNTYPNGEYPNSSVTLGLTLENPNLPQYIPMAIRLGDKWQELDNGLLPNDDNNDDDNNDDDNNDDDNDNDNDNDNGNNDDPNIQPDYNLYNINFDSDDKINFPFDPDGTNPDYPMGGAHNGVDTNMVNETLYAPTSGTAYTNQDPLPRNEGGRTGFGNHIILEGNDGYQYMFGHLESFNIKNGQKVKVGDNIAQTDSTGDSTGPHLHFEIRKGAQVNDSFGGTGTLINPMTWRDDVRSGKLN